ncbi:MAG: methanogenesis marker 3 protein [Methanoregulaceae archaeon]
MVTVHLDGRKVETPAGATIGSLLPGHDPASVIAIIRPAERESAETGHIRITTTAGEVILEGAGPLAALLDRPDLVPALGLHWSDRYAAAFGPFPSEIKPLKRPQLYERGDVILGCGGYDPSSSYLVFSKVRHSADHGAPDGRGVLATVVSGRAILDKWTTGDRVIRIERVVSWADTSRSFTTTDISLPVEEGMQIVTRVAITAQGYSPEGIDTHTAESVEHLLLALNDGTYRVGQASSTYLRDERRSGEAVAAERMKPRREGSVTARTDGKSAGNIYLYRADVPSSTVHTIVGQIASGIELVKLAKEGDVFSISVIPPKFDLLGRSLADAMRIAEGRKIQLISDTEESPENRVIVSQQPGTTLEVLKKGTVTIETTPLAKVIDLSLDDLHAPESCAVFRRLTGLAEHDIGILPFFFTFEDVYLFKPDIPVGTKLIPENTPLDCVPANALGITNDARKGAGLVGVRLICHTEFGPTSEPFEGTNIIGTILSPEKLKGIKEKEIVFIREVKG